MNPLFYKLVGRVWGQTSDRIGRWRSADGHIRLICYRVYENPDASNEANIWPRSSESRKAARCGYRLICYDRCCQLGLRTGKNASYSYSIRVQIMHVKKFFASLIMDYEGAQISSLLRDVVSIAADLKPVGSDCTDPRAIGVPYICVNPKAVRCAFQSQELAEINNNRIKWAVIGAYKASVAHDDHEVASVGPYATRARRWIVCGLKPAARGLGRRNWWRKPISADSYCHQKCGKQPKLSPGQCVIIPNQSEYTQYP